MLGKTSRELVSGDESGCVQDCPFKMSACNHYCSQDGLSPEDCVNHENVRRSGKHRAETGHLRDSTRGCPSVESSYCYGDRSYRPRLGDQSAEAVCALIESGDPWLQVNAAFVAGDGIVAEAIYACRQATRIFLISKWFASNRRSRFHAPLDSEVLYRLEGWFPKDSLWQKRASQRG